MTKRGNSAARRPNARSSLRVLGTLLVVAGLFALLWAGVVWRWQDPVTASYAWWQQRELADSYGDFARDYRTAAAPTGPSGARTSLGAIAAEYRRTVRKGAPMGRLRVPRLGIDTVVVNGTDAAWLRKGPGRDPRTFMPGQGKLVYVAGHRTTFGAPFAHIDDLRAGDRIEMELPYGTFTYAVTGHSIVDATDLSVLRSRGAEQIALQACHPRFFASHRYIVWGALRRIAVAPDLRGKVQLPS